MSKLTANEKQGLVRSIYDQGGFDYEGTSLDQLHDNEDIQSIIGSVIFYGVHYRQSFEDILQEIIDLIVCPSSYNLSQISAWTKRDFAHRVG